MRRCFGLLLAASVVAFVIALVFLETETASATSGLIQISADTKLTEDHSGPIDIVADDVTLDCAGHNVHPDSASVGGHGITVANRSNVTVRNCHSGGFVDGIAVSGSFGVVLFGNSANGIGDGIAIRSSSATIIDSNTPAGNDGSGIAVLDGSTGTTIIRNVATRNGISGIELADSDGNTLTNNTADGILLRRANSNTLSNNQARDNEGHGFELYDSDNNALSGNQARDNEGHGFRVHSSDNNTLKGNLAESNTHNGFHTADSNGNSFSDNGSHRNGDWGFFDGLHGQPVAGANAYSRNYCTGNSLGGSSPSGLCQEEEQVGLVNSATGEWHLRHSEDDVTSFYYGNPGDYPFMGDWDCDGTDTPGLYRQSDGFAYLRNANTQGNADVSFLFGNPGDVPIAGDFNADGCDTLSIYRPSNQRFYIINELGKDGGGLGAADYEFLFGNPGDTPVVGDWDGDGVDEIGLHRETTGFFYYRNTLTTGIADGQFYFGDPGDRFIAGDWGVVDGLETPAMFRPSNTTFYFRHTMTQGNADSQFTWTGADTDSIPVAGDFNLN
jgi:parallel beta-helix repeat protein